MIQDLQQQKEEARMTISNKNDIYPFPLASPKSPGKHPHSPRVWINSLHMIAKASLCRLFLSAKYIGA